MSMQRHCRRRVLPRTKKRPPIVWTLRHATPPPPDPTEPPLPPLSVMEREATLLAMLERLETLAEESRQHAAYEACVDNAHDCDERGDREGYLFWWSWRMVHSKNWTEAERLSYMDWKREQLASIDARAATALPS